MQKETFMSTTKSLIETLKSFAEPFGDQTTITIEFNGNEIETEARFEILTFHHQIIHPVTQILLKRVLEIWSAALQIYLLSEGKAPEIVIKITKKDSKVLAFNSLDVDDLLKDTLSKQD